MNSISLSPEQTPNDIALARLNSLPQEVWNHIFKKLYKEDLARLDRTCHFFSGLLMDWSFPKYGSASYTTLFGRISPCIGGFEPSHKQNCFRATVETENFKVSSSWGSIQISPKKKLGEGEYIPEEKKHVFNLPGMIEGLANLGGDVLGIVSYNCSSSEVSRARLDLGSPKKMGSPEVKTYSPPIDCYFSKNHNSSWKPYIIANDYKVYFFPTEGNELIPSELPLRPTDKIKSLINSDVGIWVLLESGELQCMVYREMEFKVTWSINLGSSFDHIRQIHVRFSRLEIELSKSLGWVHHDGWNSDDGYEYERYDLFIYDLETKARLFHREVTDLGYFSVQRDSFIYQPRDYPYGIENPSTLIVEMLNSKKDKMTRHLGFSTDEMHIDAQNHCILIKKANTESWYKIEES